MRRRLYALLVGVLVGALVLSASPAQAIEVPPPPVTPAGGLPSWSGVYYNPAGLTPGSPAYNDWMASMQARLTSAGYAPPKAPITTQSLKPSPSLPFRPLTLPASLGARAAGGGILGAAAVGGWAVGNGGLMIYGVATNSNPWAVLCTDAPGDAVLADIQRGLNFGIGPDCAAPVASPNTDKTPVKTLSYAGSTITRLGTVSYSVSSLPYQADCWSGSLPAGGSLKTNPPLWNTGLNFSGTTPMSRCLTSFPSRTGSTAGGAYEAPPSPVAIFVNNVKVADEVNTYPNPSRSLTCEINWDDGTTTTGTGDTYTETGALPTTAEGRGCASAWDAKHPGGYAGGALPSRIRVRSNDGTTTTTITDDTVGAASADQKAALATASTAGLVLKKTVDGVTDSCMTWAASCAGWWAATADGTTPTTGTTTYTCTFGGVAVALAECGIYRHTFDVQTANPTITDPVTGEEEAWISGPATGNPQNTGDPGTMPNGSTDPHGDCMAEWPSAPNPIAWVLHPVKCALVWAFVPRESEVDRLTGELTDMWEDTGVGLTINTISAWEFVPPPNNCNGVLVPMSTMFGHGIQDFSLLDACPGSPLEATAQWSYWIVLIASTINLIKSLTRNIGSVVGAKGVGEGEE